jgi:RNA polymerase sigma-70 factor, ECF subfamily
VPSSDDLDALAAAAQGGNDAAFGQLVERLRPELVVHAYRLLASMEDAEEAVQESLLQAWRHIAGFQRRSSARTWLYRITTNTCLARRTRRRRRQILAAGTMAGPVPAPIAMTVPWLEACPDDLLDLVAARQADPAAAATSRETIEIAYVAALQHLPSRQRGALVLRDVLGWPAEQAAAALEVSVAALNSSLQRGRARLREVLEPERSQWRAATLTDGEEADHVRRFVDAIERADDDALLSILAEDVVVGHQPGAGGNDADEPAWYAGRATVLEAWAPALHHPVPLQMRMIPVRVNRQPAVATYIRLPGTDHHRAFALNVLRIAHDRVTEIATLSTTSFAALGLPTKAVDPGQLG